MRTVKSLDPKIHDEIEHELSNRLRELRKTLRLHEAETSRRLPSDEEEAAPLKSEMDIVETAERSEADQIKLIEDALERLKKGTYGICESCRHAIPKERLEAVPESRYCVPCQKSFEKRSCVEDWPY